MTAAAGFAGDVGTGPPAEDIRDATNPIDRRLSVSGCNQNIHNYPIDRSFGPLVSLAIRVSPLVPADFDACQTVVVTPGDGNSTG